jgi:serine phosphatase RsbU (regulator of sigma subunit)/anti-sigma regulatory factor (Ser/Thr protein kinase)
MGKRSSAEEAPQAAAPPQAPRHTILPLDISPADPLLAYFQRQPGVVEIEKLQLDSPALAELKQANIQLVAPLVSQGQLIGLLNLGPRMSEQEYSSDDFRMLNNLASQAAPAVRVAQLVQQQQLEARQLERMEQELRVARIVQETLLPRDLPVLTGWRLAAYWQPAQAIGGDFYDFIALPDGEIGIVIADVTDKGVPAALVMASTRSILRGAAERYRSPGQVLERVNNLLCPEIPPKMFVTCLYAVFNPGTGRFWFANAGHNLPSQRTANGVLELRARGMPLGLLPDMTYEEVETTLMPGDSILVYSDGLTEAHNAQREMFGYPRLHQWLGAQAPELDGEQIVEHLKLELVAFTGPDWVQEDDVTLVLLEHLPALPLQIQSPDAQWQTLAEFSVASQPGNERQAMDQVLAVVKRELSLTPRSLERLKTAVAEATMNAIEHGNSFRAELPAEIQVLTTGDKLLVRIKDHGGGKPIPAVTDPDLQAKLDGLQSPRGWGLFLIKNMVDEMRVHSDDRHHTIELEFHLEGEPNGHTTI